MVPPACCEPPNWNQGQAFDLLSQSGKLVLGCPTLAFFARAGTVLPRQPLKGVVARKDPGCRRPKPSFLFWNQPPEISELVVDLTPHSPHHR
jgi:hypothetical protein